MFRFGLLLAGIVFVADQVTKWMILELAHFSPRGCLEAGYGCGRIELSPVVDLHMVWNRGVSFGLLRADHDIVRWVLVAAMLVIAGVFTRWLSSAERRVTAIALGLVIGGALGNVIDRIRFGAVVDFIDFSMDGRFFPWVFNVADAAISVGAILLLVDMIFLAETEPGKGSTWSQIKRRFAPPANGSGG
jgi:signal peptidase II